jgi:phosphatidylglycerophosphate synthase
MPQELEPALSPLEATYKMRDVEGVIDLYFYRRVAFRLAQLFARLKLTPAAVTVLGGICGIVAGHLYFYPDLATNAVGMVLHVFANTLDNADGQLARLLNQRSRMGRVLDSVFDHLIFLSIYVHLGLRALVGGAPPAIVLLVLAAGISHALQGAAADYFRSAYLYFAKGRSGADWDSTADLRADFQELDWKHQGWNKLLLALYLNFTRQQELLSPRLRALRAIVVNNFQNGIPEPLRHSFRERARPYLRAWGLLMTNTRMLLLFLFLIIGRPTGFFWLELTALNALLGYLIIRQENLARSLLKRAGGLLTT